MVLKFRSVFFGCAGEAAVEKIDGASWPPCLDGDDGEIAAFVVAGRLQRDEPVLHVPDGGPFLSFGMDGFDVVEDANHDRTRIGDPETAFDEFVGKTRHTADELAALVESQDASAVIGVDKERPARGLVACEEVARRGNTLEV